MPTGRPFGRWLGKRRTQFQLCSFSGFCPWHFTLTSQRKVRAKMHPKEHYFRQKTTAENNPYLPKKKKKAANKPSPSKKKRVWISSS
jgi:hypothetical protein